MSGSLIPVFQETEPNKDVTFNLELTSPEPSGSWIEWYVDGVLKKSAEDLSFTVSFPTVGTHTILAWVMDEDNATLMKTQSTVVIVAKAFRAFYI